MHIHPNKYINFLLQLLFLAVVGLAVYFGFKYVFKLLLPLLVAYLLSCLIIRPVNYLNKRFNLPRTLTSAVLTLLIVSVVGTLLYLVVYVLLVQGAEFANALPGMIAALIDSLDTVQTAFTDLLSRLPGLEQAGAFFSLERWLGSIQLPQINVGGVLSSVGSAASSLPGLLISAIFIFMATFFLTSQRAEIVDFIRRQTGGKIFSIAREMKRFFYTSVFKWIKAQCILVCVTFCILLTGMLILHQPYAVVVALLIAVIDALPILGVGTVLVPWAVIDLFSGSYSHAAAMCILYAAVLVVRNSLEPKIVGTQLGLHPFVTLLSVYFGFRIAGFLGMFLIPVAVLCTIELQKLGHIHVWKQSGPEPGRRDGV